MEHRKVQQMFQIKNEAEKATVYLYGTIGADFWSEEDSNTAKQFSQTLDDLNGKPLDIRIDSCGGDVYEGFAIASAIQRYEGQTTAFVDGIAASAASYIAVMADKVVMTQYAQLMIHDASTVAWGNAEEFRQVIDRLENVDATIAGIIAARSGMDVDEVRKAMDAETWYTGDKAVECGLADEVIETEQRTAACIDEVLLARFKNAPKFEKSHTENTMQQAEKRFALLGNRVYRKKE